MNHRILAAVVLGASVFAPACTTARAYPDHPVPSRPAYSAYDEGLRRGLMSGAWAGYRDLGKRNRRDFWSDEQYRRASEGYRPQFGSKAAYANGFRAGYERGYRERRDRERGRSRP